MNANARIIMMIVVLFFAMLAESFAKLDFCKNINNKNTVHCCTFSKVEIIYFGFDTDTPFSISPKMFDLWCEDTSIVKITIKDIDTIAFIDSILNNAEPIDARTIDTRCRILLTREEKKQSVTDSFYLSSTVIYKKNNGIVLKNDQAIQKLISDIVSHTLK